MKIDSRTMTWSMGGAFLFLIVVASTITRIVQIPNWFGGVFVGLGFIIGFGLDQYYKHNDTIQQLKEGEGQ